MTIMQERLGKLLAAVTGARNADSAPITILLHNSPDPDAIASGVALRHLLERKTGLAGRIVYRGVIGRAENKALVQYLRPPLEELPEGAPIPAGPLALVDTQPGAGNSPLPAGAAPAIVIDHHGNHDHHDNPEASLDSESCRFRIEASFSDVRPWIGATSTILTQYLRAAGLKPSRQLATALLYGIKSDTKALSRKADPADVSAYFYLLPLVDAEALVGVEQAEVPAAYFKKLSMAIDAACVYDGLVVSYMGFLDYPDLTAEVADLLLRLEGVRWAVCLGAYEDVLHFSVRVRQEELAATTLAEIIAGDLGSAGGHETAAGGQIPLLMEKPEVLVDQIRRRAIACLAGKGFQFNPEPVGRPLV